MAARRPLPRARAAHPLGLGALVAQARQRARAAASSAWGIRTHLWGVAPPLGIYSCRSTSAVLLWLPVPALPPSEITHVARGQATSPPQALEPGQTH